MIETIVAIYFVILVIKIFILIKKIYSSKNDEEQLWRVVKGGSYERDQ